MKVQPGHGVEECESSLFFTSLVVLSEVVEGVQIVRVSDAGAEGIGDWGCDMVGWDWVTKAGMEVCVE
jgi:16S rRNA C1402 (ribose-2'-O) methylase RsmI